MVEETEDARGGRHRRSAPATTRRPIVKLVNRILGRRRPAAGLRHPHRGAARHAARPLPRRRPAARRHDRAAADRDRRHQPHQDHLRPRHRRAARAAGRPHPDRGRRASAIDCRDQHAAVAARREGRHPPADPGRRRPAAGVARASSRSSSRTFEAALACRRAWSSSPGRPGSGKTNTLYSAIAAIQTPEKNIVTLEDPVEVQLPGITQVQRQREGRHDVLGRACARSCGRTRTSCSSARSATARPPSWRSRRR